MRYPNKTHSVAILAGTTAERIGTSDKMEVIIKAAALDIENNFLPLECFKVFVNGNIQLTTTDESGELLLSLQYDYTPDSEVIVQIEHEATGKRSPKKLLT